MNDKLRALYHDILELEHRVSEELQQSSETLRYRLERGRIVFEEETRKRHKRLAKKLHRFIYDSGIIGVLIAPLMYSMIVPLLFLHVSLTVFQWVVFSYYKIPKVDGKAYIVIDRQRLQYLNAFEKLNCAYCGYANGLIAYVREILARTEKHWCPIRHALRTRAVHSQYGDFLEYGDADRYREVYETIRNEYEV